MTPEQQQEIINLREKKLTPKQIARKLGLKVSEVSSAIKEQAEQTTLSRAATGELNPLVECLVNARCAEKFLGNSTTQESEESDDLNSGLAIVSVTRQVGYNRLSVCTYMLDLWCLGVKDTIGPRQFERMRYLEFMEAVYHGFAEEAEKISLEQAQALVFSAVDYATQLGFEPHPDFEKSRSHLGEWSGEPKIECGRNGKPYYISGPYDNPNKILKTLRETVGEGNFDYLLEMG